MSTTTLDPALKRLLDELPAGSPDPQQPDRIMVWLLLAPPVWTIICGEATELRFGPWLGPPMKMREIRIVGRFERTGNECTIELKFANPAEADHIVQPGHMIQFTLMIPPERPS